MAAQNVAHEKLVNEILRRFGAIPHWRIWKNNTGTAFRGHRQVSFGLVGSADILGITKEGIFVAIEVKTGKAVLSKQQRSFRKMVEDMKGFYFLVRSIQDIDQIFGH